MLIRVRVGFPEYRGVEGLFRLNRVSRLELGALRIKRALPVVIVLIFGCRGEPQMITDEEVRGFLDKFEELAAQRRFELVEPHIHKEAYFRFNDGDFRGVAEIRQAFEKTWATTSQAIEDRYYLTDIVVLTNDVESATATYTYNWEGKFEKQEFSVQGRGTRVLTRSKGDGLQIIHEHLSRFPE